MPYPEKTMIHIKHIDNTSTAYDANFAIVRSLRRNDPKLIQVKDLSPSEDLFAYYIRLKHTHNWNIEKFKETFVPRYLSEIKNNPEAIKLIKNLKTLDSMNKQICVACYCKKVRSYVIGLYLQEYCNL